MPVHAATAAKLANRSARTLCWEIWRRGRLSGWLALALLGGCLAFNLVLPTSPHKFGTREGIFTFLMVISLALVFAVFHGTEFRPGKEWHGFPYRWFVLPVPTFLLIACPMGLGVLSIGAMNLAWSRLVFAPLGVTVPAWLSLVLGAGLVSYQAVLWSLAGFRVTRIVILSLTALLFVNLSFAFMAPDLAPQLTRSVVMGMVTGLGALAFLGAWFSVERQRRGGGRGRGRTWSMLARMGDLLPRRQQGFASPAAAQFWYEWRRAGWLLPAATGAALVLVFVPVSWRLRHEAETAWWILGWACILPVLLAAVIGKGFSKPDFWTMEVSLPPFLAVRPITSGDLVVIKMKVALQSVVVAWLFVFGFLAGWLSLWANLAEVRETLADWKFLRGWFWVFSAGMLFAGTGMALSWRCLVSGFWLGLSGDRRRVNGSLLSSAAAVALGIGIVGFSAKNYRPDALATYVTWFGWALLAAVLLKLWGALFSWRFVSSGRAARYALLWAIATAALASLGWRACPDIFWLKHLVLLAALLPFPLARLGLAPGALSNNRHRK